MSKVDDLIEAGNAAEDDAAKLAKYFAALELDFNNPTIHYNIGLVYKYQSAWRESFKYNKRAVELRGDESELWNLGIAATALREWRTARDAWKRCEISIGDGEGPIEGNFGSTPVRINPDASAEVVWARRLCPVRARILNLPFPESGVAYGDIVLHDGAAVGTRIDADGREKPVFNVLEMFEPGHHSTYVIEAIANSESEMKALAELCDQRSLPIEDWHSSVRTLCRACSEGRPHQQHDHEARDKSWKRERRIGIAARSQAEVESLIDSWSGEVTEWGLALER